MKICPICGNENDDIAKACTSCGTRLTTKAELELKYGTPKTAPAVEVKKQDELTNSLGQLNKMLSEQNKILSETYKHIVTIDQNASAIRGWVTFLGILALIGLIFGLISGCGAFFGL